MGICSGFIWLWIKLSSEHSKETVDTTIDADLIG
jgi:hypothetical protein